jgi:hypothetical protein
MFIRCWNIKCLNDPVKHLTIHFHVQKHLVAPFGLIEIQVNKYNVSQLSFQNWAYLFNYDHSNGDRI